MDNFPKVFTALIPELRIKIMRKFQQKETQTGFRSVWEEFEGIITSVVIDTLKNSQLQIKSQNITIAKSKSVYPDIKISLDGNSYAIDIKSGANDKKEPWYDMGRMDTFEEKHLEKYQDEYYITVRWENKERPRVIDIYIEPMRWSVGFYTGHNCILFRPYDGKIRPKSWEDFESNKIYWNSKDDFRKGFEIAKNHRRMNLIKEWYKDFDKNQRSMIRKEISEIDKNI